MVLMSLYGHRELVKRASSAVLHDLVNVIVLILLEPGVAELPEGSQLVRALNVLTVKIVDRSEHNAVSGALVKLLHECIGSSVLSGKYCMLVMKCIWKVIRGLPSWLEAGMDVSLLLADLHSFLVSYPGSYWKQQADDTPMRTVKTVIHTLVKQQGEAILGCLNRIQDPQASELVPYIRKLLNSGVGDDAPASAANNNNSSHNNAVASSEKKKMPRFTKSDHEALVDIFKKIGQKELTKVGLQELFSFKQKNPHVDLEPFLAQSSQYFRDYIERGLRKIEEEGCALPISSIGGIGGMSGIPPPRTSVLSDNTAVGGSQGSQPQHLVYLERLKKLRAAGGLSEPADQENVENFSGGVSSGVREGYSIGSGYSTGRLPQSSVSNQRFSAAQPIDNQEENQNMAAPNVDEIRKRLAKIKAQAF
jgi:cytoskeleton-associated protein 5